ncbi:cold shock domain-containing protein [Rubrobacter indicoceani]|uniref:cold shock domain-containing protein n=1 Tax=Rubrobacter indicoceani TaxID=2051957 RepID=UPI001F08DF2C|nr:cold shock domain-containing protein [Rubrobacter indicoceani]
MDPERRRNGERTVVGTVRWFSEEKGFGLIGLPDGGCVVVDHPGIAPLGANGETNGFRVLAGGRKVEFELVQNSSGRLCAVGVREVGAKDGGEFTEGGADL